MGFVSEFKQFAMKGNVVDMAVGIILGAAFGKIVSSMVANLITPLLGLLLGGVDFKHLQIVLKPAPEGGQPIILEYGIFLQTAFDFIIVALAIFVAIKAMNTLKKKQDAKPETPPALPEDIQLLREIRDALKR